MGKQLKWTPPADAQPIADEWTPPVEATPVVDEKKNANTVNAPVSENGTTLPGSVDSSQPAPPVTEPTVNPWEVAGTVIEGVGGSLGKGLFDAGRRIVSGFTDDIPKTVSTIDLKESPRTFYDLFKPTKQVYKEAEDPKLKPFIKDYNKWFVKNRDELSDGFLFKTLKYSNEETVKKFFAERYPDNPQVLEILESKFGQKVIERRLQDEVDIQSQSKESATKMAGAVQDYRGIKDLSTLASYIGTQGGQAAYQIPLAILTRGSSSLLQESATIYDQQLDNLARAKGITREEVIKQKLDDPAAGQAYAVLAAALDVGSAGNLIKAFRSGGGSFIKKWARGAVPEAITEPTQGVLERQGAKTGSPTDQAAFDAPSMINEAAGGLIGGSVTVFGGKSTPEVIQEQKIKVDTSNPESVKNAAETIQNKFNEQQGTETNQPVNDPQPVQEGGKTTGEEIRKEPDKSGGTSIPADVTQTPGTSTVTDQPTQITDDKGTYDFAGVSERLSKGQEAQATEQQNPEAIAGEQTITQTDEQTTTTQEPVTPEGGLSEGNAETANTQQDKPLVVDAPAEQGSTQPAGNAVAVEQATASESAPASTEQSTPPVAQAENKGSYTFTRPITPPPDSASGTVPPTSTPATEASPIERQPGQTAVGARIEASEEPGAIKESVAGRDRYIPRHVISTNEEAKVILDKWTDDEAEAAIRDTSNEMPGGTRTTLAANLYERYKGRNDFEKAADIAVWAAQNLTKAGQETAIAGKIWKSVLGSEDVLVLALEKENQQVAQNIIAPDREQVTKSKEQFDAEVRRLVEQKVQETVEKRVDRAKKITKEQKKQISDFFDGLKIKDVGSTANDVIRVLGSAVWNGAVETIKRAVLTGADVANAVQAGLDYIKANHQGEFSEEEYRTLVTPSVEQMVPKEPIKAGEINPDAVDVPLKGRKKKEFIDKVVDAYNEGKLTDKKFDELYASKKGFREFSTEDRKRIRDLANVVATAEKFEQQLKDDFTPENIKKYKEYVDAAKKANKLLQEYAQAPNNVWDTLISIMQGNLLSSISLVSNVYYNLNLQPLRFLSTGVGSIVDMSLSKLAKMGLLSKALEDRTIDIKALQEGYFQGGWAGTIEGLKQLKTGAQAEDKALREIQSSFNPSLAVDRWSNQDRTLSQKINDYVEGTIGWEAETMFRLLNLGDKPWKRAAEMARAHEIGTLRGLKGTDLKKFILVPDQASQEEITKAGQEATFQQSGEFGKAIQSGISKFLNMVATIPVVGGSAKVILKAQMPYIKTPWNLVAETLNYAAPPVTFAAGVYNISRGNKRTGSIQIGKAVVGTMIWQVATQLFIKGLLTGDDDKDEKKRKFQADNTPPANSINTSAVSRGMATGDWSIHDDDVWVSYTRMGVTGVLFDNYANQYKSRVQEYGDLNLTTDQYLTDMFAAAPRVMSSSLEQTFLYGTSTLLEAIKDGGDRKTQTWLIRTSEAVSSIVLPNTISSVSKASDEFTRDTEDEKFLQRLANTYKTKVFIGDQLPAKVSLWGDPIKGEPEGRSKYAYYLFDPTKFRQIDTDDFRYKLYQAWKSDYSGDWLPSVPSRDLTYKGEKRRLTPSEYELLSMHIGTERQALASSYVNSSSWDNDTSEAKKEYLNLIYKRGFDYGKDKFLQDSGLNVKFKFDVPIDIQIMRNRINRMKKQLQDSGY